MELTEVVTGVCDDLAELGYVAVAPDLYAGELASTAEEAAALRARKRSRPMWRQFIRSVEHARSTHVAPAVGQVGLSMGGHWALWLAKQSRPEIPTHEPVVAGRATSDTELVAADAALRSRDERHRFGIRRRQGGRGGLQAPPRWRDDQAQARRVL